MIELTASLDVRTIPPPSRHIELSRVFDALGPGESFILVNDHEPTSFLRQLQVERAGRFEWNVLEAGPERFRIEIVRRAPPAARPIADLLRTDHARFNRLLAASTRSVSAADLTRAAARFRELKRGLERHMDMEEEVLFPALRGATGMRGESFVALRAKHAEIRTLLRRGSAVVRCGNALGAYEMLGGLGALLRSHNIDEEQVFDSIDELSPAGEHMHAEIVRRMQAVRDAQRGAAAERPMAAHLATIEFYARIGLAAFAFLPVTVFFCLMAVLFWGHRRIACWYGRVLGHVVAFLLGVRVVVGHHERMPKDPCIYVGNHQSNLDAVFAGVVFPPHTVVIAKREILFFPLFGLFFLATRNILIDRADRAKAIAGLDKAVAALRREGRSVWIYPEGTRNRGDEPLGPFKKGAFHMAIAAGVPIVPIVMAPIRERVDLAARRLYGGSLLIDVLEPIAPRADETPEALRDRVRGSMLEAIVWMRGASV